MSPGKLAAQVAHAAVDAVLQMNLKFHKVENWKAEGSPKIILAAISADQLLIFQERARTKYINTALIRDAGKTEIEPGTITCLALGPDEDHIINQITGSLKLL